MAPLLEVTMVPYFAIAEPEEQALEREQTADKQSLAAEIPSPAVDGALNLDVVRAEPFLNGAASQDGASGTAALATPPPQVGSTREAPPDSSDRAPDKVEEPAVPVFVAGMLADLRARALDGAGMEPPLDGGSLDADTHGSVRVVTADELEAAGFAEIALAAADDVANDQEEEDEEELPIATGLLPLDEDGSLAGQPGLPFEIEPWSPSAVSPPEWATQLGISWPADDGGAAAIATALEEDDATRIDAVATLYRDDPEARPAILDLLRAFKPRHGLSLYLAAVADMDPVTAEVGVAGLAMLGMYDEALAALGRNASLDRYVTVCLLGGLGREDLLSLMADHGTDPETSRRLVDEADALLA